MSSNVIECSCRKGDDDECLLIGDEKQFYQRMAKLSALRNAGMPSGHQPKFRDVQQVAESSPPTMEFCVAG